MSTVSVILAELLRDSIESRVRGIYTCTVGKVHSYNAKDQTVEVELVMLEPINVIQQDREIEHIEHPVLPDVPIAFPRAGGFYIFMPPAKGDYVLVVFTHENVGTWRETGAAKSVPGFVGRHDLSNGVAILGIGPQTSLLADPPNATMPSDQMVIGAPGVVRVGSATAADFVALSQKVDAGFAAVTSFINSHTHTAPTGGGPTMPPAPPMSSVATVAAKKLKSE